MVKKGESYVELEHYVSGHRSDRGPIGSFGDRRRRDADRLGSIRYIPGLVLSELSDGQALAAGLRPDDLKELC